MRFAFFCLAFCLSTAQAQWNSGNQNVDYFGDFPNSDFSLRQKSFSATLWSLNRNIVPYRVVSLSGNSLLNITMPHVFNRPFPVAAVLQTERGPRPALRASNIKRAPLLIFIPGVFANLNEGSTRITVDWFSKLGFHILILPNPWGTDFINADIRLNLNSPDIERYAFDEILKVFKAHVLPEERISHVELLGESLGAFIASVVYAHDSQRSRPWIDGVSLYWPPVDVRHSLVTMDRLLDIEQQNFYERGCRASQFNPLNILNLIDGTIFDSPKYRVNQCAPSIVAFAGFHSSLVSSAIELNRRDRKNLVPSRYRKGETSRSRFLNPEFKRWERSFRFMNFIEDFYPQYLPVIESERMSLTNHWLMQAYNNGQRDIKLFSSRDDFINDRLNFRNSFDPVLRGKDHIRVESWGGHTGLTAHESFYTFLKSQYH